ncbi:hypothetical protein VBX90_001341 [Enterococcus faecalis]|jgi:hypothetical protein|nr:hypothetical protein [Enterococcus faecalis]EGO5982644.1 hypothetical protein [Enterococcus faecalis]EGO5985197.1 hypothetical protein [Enterococcus faecalis]EGO6132341.1 hypothetical protein [Enterococcus faecalis]EGO6520262.1 hypothetical protein [Enterococcus faecalis]EGO7691498.1 hypothetical protein [Enterococcus faecalis]
MDTQELINLDSRLGYLTPQERMTKFANFITSLNVIDNELQIEAQDTYHNLASLLQALRELNWPLQKLIDEINLPDEQKQIVIKYMYDLNYVGGLGAAGKVDKNPDDPINLPENISLIKDLVGIFTSVILAGSAILGPTYIHIQNKEMNRLERIRIEQRNRELDQRDRELDILDSKN